MPNFEGPAGLNIITVSRLIRVTVVSRASMHDPGSARARTEVSRYAHGVIRATIEIAITTDLTELLPHEFEHVIEQLEGIDLRALAQRREGAWSRLTRASSKPRRRGRRGLQAYREVSGRVARPSRRQLAASAGPGARWARQLGRESASKSRETRPGRRPASQIGLRPHLHKRW
jgi:hypothetical protein